MLSVIAFDDLGSKRNIVKKNELEVEELMDNEDVKQNERIARKTGCVPFEIFLFWILVMFVLM